MECIRHPGNQIVMVCVTCDNTLICLDCATDNHRGHVFGKFEEVAKNIQKRCKNLRHVSIELKHDHARIMAAKKDQDTLYKEEMSRIGQQRDLLYSMVDDVARNLLLSLEKQHKYNISMLKEQEHTILTQMGIMENHEGKVNKILNSTNYADIILLARNMQNIFVNRNILEIPFALEFAPGVPKPDKLEKMFGELFNDRRELPRHMIPVSDLTHFVNLNLNQTSPQLVSQRSNTTKRQSVLSHRLTNNTSKMTSKSSSSASWHQDTSGNTGSQAVVEAAFSHSQSTGISYIATSYPGHAWIKCSGRNELQLADRSGHIKRIVRFTTTIRGIAVSSNRILVCCFDAHCVKKVLLPSYNIVNHLDTDQLKPNYICTTINGETLLTLVDKATRETTHDSQRRVVRFTESGKEVARAQYDQSGGQIFTLPGQIRVGYSGATVAVTNETDEENAHLVILDNKLNLKMRYIGDGKVIRGHRKFIANPGRRFFINDVDFDTSDNILVAESHTRSVQLLDSRCRLLRTLIQEASVPWALTANEFGEIWIGLDNGKVKVYRIKTH